MYTILITESNELVTSQRERIMQRSKLVDSLRFLADQSYKGVSMSDFTVLMEYVLPVSREYHSEILILSEELYKDKLEYRVPFDTSLTREPGEIEVQISFIKPDLDADGRQVQYVRKTSPVKINIVPIAAWSDIIADDALNPIDQRIMQMQAMINELNDMSEQMIDAYDTKADGLSYDGNKLQLKSGDKLIGNEVDIANASCECEDDGSIQVISF